MLTRSSIDEGQEATQGANLESVEDVEEQAEEDGEEEMEEQKEGA